MFPDLHTTVVVSYTQCPQKQQVPTLTGAAQRKRVSRPTAPHSGRYETLFRAATEGMHLLARMIPCSGVLLALGPISIPSEVLFVLEITLTKLCFG